MDGHITGQSSPRSDTSASTGLDDFRIVVEEMRGMGFSPTLARWAAAVDAACEEARDRGDNAGAATLERVGEALRQAAEVASWAAVAPVGPGGGAKGV